MLSALLSGLAMLGAVMLGGGMHGAVFAADLRIDLHIDHASVAGRDLKAMQAALSRAGMVSEYGGRHSNHATEMAVTSFADGSYLELIAIQPDADRDAVARHDWSKQLQNNAGPAAWAVRVDDLDAERERLGRAHIVVGPPEKSGRLRPDGFRLEWETAQVGSESRGTYFPFLIRDITPRNARALLTGKPAMPSLRGFTRVVIATGNLKASIARFRAAYNWPLPTEQDDRALEARVAVFRGSPVVLAAPLGKDSWIARRLNQFGDGPCAYVIGTTNATTFTGVAESRWPGSKIRWLDSRSIGWHLGME